MSLSCDNCCSSENADNVQLLRDIEAISKSLYLHQPFQSPSTPSSVQTPSSRKSRILQNALILRSGADAGGNLNKLKKSGSAWSWKNPMKALSRIRDRRFSCFFSLHVHSIEGLPDSFEESSLCVGFVRKDEELRTRPSRVSKGISDFDDTLMHRCTVFCHKINGSYNSCKYDPKLFLVHAYINEAPGIDLGKHRVDLTGLLPVTFEELDGKKSSGKWTTCFKLAGEAKGAVLNVSFGYSLDALSIVECSGGMTVSELISMSCGMSSSDNYNAGSTTGSNKSVGRLRRSGSIPGSLNRLPSLLPWSTGAKACHKPVVNPALDLSKSIHFVYQKLDEDKSMAGLNLLMECVDPVKAKPNPHADTIEPTRKEACDEMEYVVIDRGIEVPKKEIQGNVYSSDGPPIEGLNVDEILTSIGLGGVKEIQPNVNEDIDANSVDSDFWLIHEEKNSGHCPGDVITEYKLNRIGRKSLSLDLESADNHMGADFLDVHATGQDSLGKSLDGDPESPRERLLREFQEEALASGNFVIGFCSVGEEGGSEGVDSVVSDSWADSDDFIITSALQSPQDQHDGSSWSLKYRRKFNMLEDLETEAFQNTQLCDSSGFGSPVELSHM